MMGNLFFTMKNLHRKHSVKITGAACTGNFIAGTGKLAMGLVTLSFFTCISALYTYGMVIARLCALRGIGREKEKQYAYYRLTGIILIIASAFYTIYSMRLLWRPDDTGYNLYEGITIATFTFLEIGLSIRGVIRERRSSEMMMHAVRMVNLAASLVSLVLTQTALLSFTHEGMTDYDPSVANGAMGMIMGSVSMMVGCFMMFRVRRMSKKITGGQNDTHSGCR